MFKAFSWISGSLGYRFLLERRLQDPSIDTKIFPWLVRNVFIFAPMVPSPLASLFIWSVVEQNFPLLYLRFWKPGSTLMKQMCFLADDAMKQIHLLRSSLKIHIFSLVFAHKSANHVIKSVACMSRQHRSPRARAGAPVHWSSKELLVALLFITQAIAVCMLLVRCTGTSAGS